MFIACFNPFFQFIYVNVETIGYVFRRVRLSVDYLSSKSAAYFDFFVQELMLITAFSLAVFSTFANLVEGLFYRNLLCNIFVQASALYFYLCIF